MARLLLLVLVLTAFVSVGAFLAAASADRPSIRLSDDLPVHDVLPDPVVPPEIALPLTRELAVDTESTDRILELLAEIEKLKRANEILQEQLHATDFAAQLAHLNSDGPMSVSDASRMLDTSYLTEDSTMRSVFAVQADRRAVLDLLRDEPKLRTELARLRANPNPVYQQFQWPVERDALIQAFANRLSNAGLSSRFIENYRLSLADYL